MTAIRSLALYEDVRSVLDVALNHRGGRYICDTYGAAVHWKHRAYAFRSLLRKQKMEASFVPGFDPGTPYDKLILRVPKKGDPDDHIVTIAYAEPRGTFEPNIAVAAEPIAPILVSAPALDLDLDLEIAELKKKLGRED
jgi:hypothetical protein